VTTSNDNKTTTVTSKEGTVSIGQNAVDPASLGVPVYPSYQQTAGMSTSDKNGAGQMVTLKTADAFDKVYNWYKGQLPAGSEQIKTSSGGNSMAEFVVAAKGTTIMINSEGAGETDIVITQPAPSPPAASST
jgi:hypothetical protein